MPGSLGNHAPNVRHLATIRNNPPTYLAPSHRSIITFMGDDDALRSLWGRLRTPDRCSGAESVNEFVGRELDRVGVRGMRACSGVTAVRLQRNSHFRSRRTIGLDCSDASELPYIIDADYVESQVVKAAGEGIAVFEP